MLEWLSSPTWLRRPLMPSAAKSSFRASGRSLTIALLGVLLDAALFRRSTDVVRVPAMQGTYLYCSGGGRIFDSSVRWEFRRRNIWCTVRSMAAISMDVSDRASRRGGSDMRVPRQRSAVLLFRVGNTRTDKKPTEFGYRLLSEMRDAGLKAAARDRNANVSPSTVTRLIYGGVVTPDTDTLDRIAAALVDAQLDPR